MINQTAIYNWKRVTEPFNEREAVYAFYAARENNPTVQKIRREIMERKKEK